MNRTWSFFVVALAASAAFTGCQERGRDADGTVVRFLHYNDLHAHVDRSWKLLPITSDIPEDAEMKGLVDQARAPFLVADPNLQIPGATGAPLALHESIATVIGYVPKPLDRKNALDSTFNDFFTEALRSRAATQLAMAPGFRFDSPIPTAASLVETNVIVDGAMTLEDAYRFFPVVYAMGVEILRDGRSYVGHPIDTSTHGPQRHATLAGVSLDPAAPGRRTVTTAERARANVDALSRRVGARVSASDQASKLGAFS